MKSTPRTKPSLPAPQPRSPRSANWTTAPSASVRAARLPPNYSRLSLIVSQASTRSTPIGCPTSNGEYREQRKHHPALHRSNRARLAVDLPNAEHEPVERPPESHDSAQSRRRSALPVLRHLV